MIPVDAFGNSTVRDVAMKTLRRFETLPSLAIQNFVLSVCGRDASI